MQQRFVVKAAVYIADMRRVAQVLDQEKQPVRVFDMLAAAVLSSTLVREKFCGILPVNPRRYLVCTKLFLSFCHMPFDWGQFG